VEKPSTTVWQDVEVNVIPNESPLTTDQPVQSTFLPPEGEAERVKDGIVDTPFALMVAEVEEGVGAGTLS